MGFFFAYRMKDAIVHMVISVLGKMSDTQDKVRVNKINELGQGNCIIKFEDEDCIMKLESLTFTTTTKVSAYQQ